MPKHIHQGHPDSGHFFFDGDVLKLMPTARGGGHLTNTPQVTTTVAGTKYKVPMTLANGSSNEIEIDNTGYGLKYTGSADKTLLFMASMGASSDTNATDCEWELYLDAAATGIKMPRYFDKQNKGGSFTLMGRVDVKQNETLHIHVSSDIAGAVISHSTINIEILQV